GLIAASIVNLFRLYYISSLSAWHMAACHFAAGLVLRLSAGSLRRIGERFSWRALSDRELHSASCCLLLRPIPYRLSNAILYSAFQSTLNVKRPATRIMFATMLDIIMLHDRAGHRTN